VLPRRSPGLWIALAAGAFGCVQAPRQPILDSIPVQQPLPAGHPVAVERPGFSAHPLTGAVVASGPSPVRSELTGPQPVDAYIRRALAENRTVQAAYHNVQSLKYRIPQVSALEDPVASNTVFPIPSVGPQYSLMGYNPYNLTIAQQFPWFGTLRLRGEVAEKDVQIALAELAAAQLDTIAAVKRAYYDLYSNQKTMEILTDSRTILEDFQTVAASRLKAGGSEQDLIKAEVLISELDRDLASYYQAITSARAAMARQIHVNPESDLGTLPQVTLADVPSEVDPLYQLAMAARPELRGRLQSIARDEKAEQLAQKRALPNVTLGLTYMDMTRQNAVSPTASGSPNVGLFVAFNLPVNQAKYRAGVSEARERTIADTKLFEAQQDEAYSEIYDLLVQARVQRNVVHLLRDTILPRTRETVELAKSDYSRGNVDIATLLSAIREVLQVQVQIAQVEAELGKALALLERAVGCHLNEHPLHLEPAAAASAPVSPPPITPGPFRATVPDAKGIGPSG
jgi:cobalt-zinc-cadmium efflux system outer membrane protein